MLKSNTDDDFQHDKDDSDDDNNISNDTILTVATTDSEWIDEWMCLCLHIFVDTENVLLGAIFCKRECATFLVIWLQRKQASAL